MGILRLFMCCFINIYARRAPDRVKREAERSLKKCCGDVTFNLPQTPANTHVKLRQNKASFCLAFTFTGKHTKRLNTKACLPETNSQLHQRRQLVWNQQRVPSGNVLTFAPSLTSLPQSIPSANSLESRPSEYEFNRPQPMVQLQKDLILVL